MEDEKKNINLMPEDLRSLETEHLEKRKVDTSTSMVRPKHDSLGRSKVGKETGSRPSIFSKIKGIFPKKSAQPVPADEPILQQQVKRNGNSGEHFDLNPVVMPAAKPVDGARPADKSDMSGMTGLDVKPEVNRPPVEPAKKTGKRESMVYSLDDEGGDEDFSIPEPKAQPKMAEPAPRPEPRKETAETAKPEEKRNKFGLKMHEPSSRIRAKFLDQEGVDLIPTAARTRSWQQVGNIILLTLIGSVIILGVFYGALYFQEQNILAQQEKREMALSGLEQQILDFEKLNTDIDDLGKEIKQVDDSLTKHIYWSRFFSLLEKYTVAEVHFGGISAGTNGGLTLEATGPNYDAVARQLKVLQQADAQEFVSQVSISSATEGEGGVTFNIVLVLNPNLFYYGSAQ